MTPSSHWCILCEGKSEITYLKLLSRFIRDASSALSLPVSFAGRPPDFGMGGGHLPDITRAYKQECKRKGDKQIRIWVDADIPLRDKAKTPDKFAKGWATSLDKWSFAFSPLVFEDFLAMHFDDALYADWKQTFAASGHFKDPLIKDKHEPLFLPFWRRALGDPDTHYDEGDLPDDWITDASLSNLFRHCSDPDLVSPVRTLTPQPTFGEFLRDELTSAFPALLPTPI